MKVELNLIKHRHSLLHTSLQKELREKTVVVILTLNVLKEKRQMFSTTTMNPSYKPPGHYPKCQ